MGAVSALKRSAVVIAGFNTAGFAVTALTQSHKITDLTVHILITQNPNISLQAPMENVIAQLPIEKFAAET